MKLTVYIDGAARGNPGPAGVGVLILDENGKTMEEHARYLGETTNNCAEYEALVDGLKLASKYVPCSITIYTDSELLFHQMSGSYRVKNERIAVYFREAQNILPKFENFEIFHINREKNKQADRLANKAVNLGIAVKT